MFKIVETHVIYRVSQRVLLPTETRAIKFSPNECGKPWQTPSHKPTIWGRFIINYQPWWPWLFLGCFNIFCLLLGLPTRDFQFRSFSYLDPPSTLNFPGFRSGIFEFSHVDPAPQHEDLRWDFYSIQYDPIHFQSFPPTLMGFTMDLPYIITNHLLSLSLYSVFLNTTYLTPARWIQQFYTTK